MARAVAEFTPEEGRLAVIAPRALHEEIAARLDGVEAGGEPDLARSVVLLGPREAKGSSSTTSWSWSPDGSGPVTSTSR